VRTETQASRIARALEALSRDLEALAEAGRDVPAVERNVVRLRGSLRALQIQFEDLAGSGD
jgi:hypothetical protein